MPSIPHLQRFVAVAEELNFRRAAARLNMSQPPLSDSIRQLEAELGTELLRRNRQSVELTRSGAVFLERARLILSQLTDAVDLTRAVARGMSGRIAVGFNRLSTYDVLPGILRRYRARHPDVSFRFEELTTAEHQDALLQKRVDVALFLAPTVVKRGIRQEIFMRERLVAVLPETHPLADRTRISVKQLSHERFIFLPSRRGTGYQGRVLFACQAMGFTPNVVQEVDRIHTLVSLVAAGLGIGLCPESLRSFSPAGATFRPLQDPKSLFQVELGISSREEDRSALTAAFIETAHAVGRGVRRSPRPPATPS